jgi:hypothetical protein
VIGPAKTVVGARHIHEQVIDVSRPNAQRISRKPPTCGNAQSGPPWLYQAQRAGNLGNASQCDDERGCQHPIRRNPKEEGARRVFAFGDPLKPRSGWGVASRSKPRVSRKSPTVHIFSSNMMCPLKPSDWRCVQPNRDVSPSGRTIAGLFARLTYAQSEMTTLETVHFLGSCGRLH